MTNKTTYGDKLWAQATLRDRAALAMWRPGEGAEWAVRCADALMAELEKREAEASGSIARDAALRARLAELQTAAETILRSIRDKKRHAVSPIPPWLSDVMELWTEQLEAALAKSRGEK